MKNETANILGYAWEPVAIEDFLRNENCSRFTLTMKASTVFGGTMLVVSLSITRIVHPVAILNKLALSNQTMGN